MQLLQTQGRTFHKEELNYANEKEGHKEEGSEEEITAALGKLICGLRTYEGLFHFGSEIAEPLPVSNAEAAKFAAAFGGDVDNLDILGRLTHQPCCCYPYVLRRFGFASPQYATGGCRNKLSSTLPSSSNEVLDFASSPL